MPGRFIRRLRFRTYCEAPCAKRTRSLETQQLRQILVFPVQTTFRGLKEQSSPTDQEWPTAPRQVSSMSSTTSSPHEEIPPSQHAMTSQTHPLLRRSLGAARTGVISPKIRDRLAPDERTLRVVSPSTLGTARDRIGKLKRNCTIAINGQGVMFRLTMSARTCLTQVVLRLHPWNDLNEAYVARPVTDHGVSTATKQYNQSSDRSQLCFRWIQN